MKIIILDSCLMYGLSCQRYIMNWGLENEEKIEILLASKYEDFIAIDSRDLGMVILDAECLNNELIIKYLYKLRKYKRKLKILLSSVVYNDLSFQDFHRMKINGLLFKGYSESEFKRYFGRVYIRSEYFDYDHIAAQLKVKQKFKRHIEQKQEAIPMVKDSRVSNKFIKIKIRNNAINFA